MSAQQPSESDDQYEAFRLLVAGGFYHPEEVSRRELRATLDQWLSQLGKTPSEEDLRQLISSESGTTLEPFVLTPTDLECAIFLARAAFSKRIGQTRFRIVSRETMGADGGLVITQNLKSYYAERYSLGRHRSQPNSGWAFIPEFLPRNNRQAGADLVQATLSTDDQGFCIVVPLPESRLHPSQCARLFQKGSQIAGVSDSFSDLGLRVESYDGQVCIRSGSPESMIRMMSFMVEERTLILQAPSQEQDTFPTTLLKLAPPQPEPVFIPALTASSPSYTAWIQASVPTLVTLKEKHKIALTSWLRPAREWLEPIFHSAHETIPR